MRSAQVLVIALLVSLCPTVAPALDVRSSEHIIIAADEVVEGDLYLSAEIVRVDGVVRGDLVAVGRKVTLRGRTEGDFIAAGQEIVVLGAVGDDMRAAGMLIKLGAEATVADHIVSAGYSFEAVPGSRVGGEVVFRGGKARIAGDIGAGLRVSGGAVELAGEVVGDAEIEVFGGMEDSPWFERFFPVGSELPLVAGGLTVKESAHIGGRLDYASPSEGAVVDGVVDAGVAWKPMPAGSGAGFDGDEHPPSLASRLGAQLRRFTALLLVGLLLLWRTPTWVDGWTEKLAKKPLPSFGWGLLGHVGFPLAVLAILLLLILLAVLVGALSLGRLVALIVPFGLAALVVLVVAFVATVVLAAPVLVSAAGGRALFARAWPARASSRYLPFIVGLVLYVVLTGMPIIGWGLGLIAIILGLGAIIQWLIALWQTDRGAEAPARV